MINKDYYLYIHFKADSLEPFYVGKGRKNRYCSTRRNIYWKRVVNKHGFIPIKLFTHLTDTEAIKLEILFISKMREAGHTLVNLTSGGEGLSGYKLSDSTKQKIGKANKGRKHTKEALQRMSQAQKGKRHTKETARKISVANKGRIFTEEHKKNISKSKKGKKLSKETCIKFSKRMSGSGNIKARKVINTETGQLFLTVTDAAASICKPRLWLCKRLRGVRINNTNLVYCNE